MTETELIHTYTPLVKAIAARYRQQATTRVDRDDLAQLGYIGLLIAYRRFNNERSRDFTAYAILRIKGEIIDGIRDGNNLRRKAKGKQVGSLPVSWQEADMHLPLIIERWEQGLDQVTKEVISHHILGRETLAQIGLARSLTESRISQIKRKAERELILSLVA